ncbi:hypothetical protein DLM45_11345 [Hyphomicrobium methylovorum]|uniref:hypothetical protein n=1 Tax=Hyphomicrobium methylovorum TaxID=84 RepID=UPI0015E6B242|nr:hypothetical protein [Hyphomicrobium methylovorum]MBA2126807.1 hypothetical protein [Hyphomicrobium methylovorum]
MSEGQLIISPETASELTRLGIPIWTRRDGTTIHLDEMEDSHIRSALTILTPWRRDCSKRGETETEEAIRQTIKMLKHEQKRRIRLQKQTLRLR